MFQSCLEDIAVPDTPHAITVWPMPISVRLAEKKWTRQGTGPRIVATTRICHILRNKVLRHLSQTNHRVNAFEVSIRHPFFTMRNGVICGTYIQLIFHWHRRDLHGTTTLVREEKTICEQLSLQEELRLVEGYGTSDERLWAFVTDEWYKWITDRLMLHVDCALMAQCISRC